MGPIDGHNLDHLLPVLRNVRDAEEHGPILLHVITQKGRGYAPAEASADKLHAVSKFNVLTGEQAKAPPGPPTLHEGVRRHADRAWPSRIRTSSPSPPRCRPERASTNSARRFPDRCFDVGIAEQHAVTFAAGLATEGIKPFCAIYSTFLQRAYDQVVHDVAIQGLPVRFCMDRAGLVGADGATHAGSFDLAYLGCLPGFVLMAPADEAELVHMVATAAAIDDRPSGVRYPRGEGTGVALPEQARGVADRPRPGAARGRARSPIFQPGDAARRCAEGGGRAGGARAVHDGRRCAVREATGHRADRAAGARARGAGDDRGRRSIGGLAAAVMQHLAWAGLLDGGLKVRPMVLPDRFIDHDSQPKQLAEARLTAKDIVAAALGALGPAQPKWLPSPDEAT